MLQFRCGEWRQSRPLAPGRRRLALSRSRPAEPPPATRELPLPLRQRLRDVAQVHVAQLLHRQREVSLSCQPQSGVGA